MKILVLFYLCFHFLIFFSKNSFSFLKHTLC
uniref:Uncharacterized protein n=1 Tax=Siphoviridae sp. ctr2f5 TaxID=2825684 RepID=A0A8S5QEK8_9CAUD|nr:MAG TPA: hypothetical protein [Siphoviridae sp. ctr2f5]